MSVGSDGLRSRAEMARERPAAHGADLDLAAFPMPSEHPPVASLAELPEGLRHAAAQVGIDPRGRGRAGSFVLVDRSAVFKRVAHAHRGQFELFPIGEAFERERLRDRWWNALDVAADKYTAWTALEPSGGFFLRVLPGARVTWPLQACMLLEERSARQLVHNVIVVEEGAELSLLVGCAVPRGAASGVHVGASEVYLERGSTLIETMIHHWGPGMHVRPRVGVVVGEGASYVSHYVVRAPARSIQSTQRVLLEGAGSRADLHSIVLGLGDAQVDLDVQIELRGRSSRAESVSRAIARDRAELFLRGLLVGRNNESAARLDCRGLLLSDAARIHALPELDADRAPRSQLSHEAAVGPIRDEVVDYLMTRGLPRDEAMAVLTRGFLDTGLPGLAEPIRRQIQQLVTLTADEPL
jgi:Fe-S cluster assembly scaffold protein SufB